MGKSRPKQQKEVKEKENVEEASKIVQKSVLYAYPIPKQLEVIKETYHKIILCPQKDIKLIETLFMLAKTPDLQVVSTSLRVLADVFTTVSPLEAIDMTKLQQRIQTQIKKDEYEVIKFERLVVHNYDRYLKILKEINSKIKKQNFNNDHELYKQFKKCILECVIKCYSTLWNFNFIKELNQLLMKFIKFQECRKFLKSMLEDNNIAMIGIKSRIISGVAKFIINADEKTIPNDLIQILNSTHIDTRYLKKDSQTLEYKKKLVKNRMYKEQAFQSKKQKQKQIQNGTLEAKRKKKEEKAIQKLKVKEEVDKEFAEAEVTLKKKEIVKHNSSILQELFYLYFKMIVERTHVSLLKDVFDGILKFAHFINIQLIQSLIEHLDVAASFFRECWKHTKKIDFLDLRLIIVFTGESIINGPLSVYNMADTKICSHFYKILKDINAESKLTLTGETHRLLGISLQETFIKRRQLSSEIVGSFVRELALLLSKNKVPKMYLLEFIRLVGYRYDKISRMFEADNEGYGINSFMSHCQDPQCSNGINTEVITYLKQIKPDYGQDYPAINKLISQLQKQQFNQRTKQSLQELLSHDLQLYP